MDWLNQFVCVIEATICRLTFVTISVSSPHAVRYSLAAQVVSRLDAQPVRQGPSF
jgi:hypothetical protein